MRNVHVLNSRLHSLLSSRYGTMTRLLCKRKWSVATGVDSCSFAEPEGILFRCQG